MKKLIITADDYGMCKSTNEAIDACLAAGTVHATCVMMNMPEFNDMTSLRSRFPWVSKGIHWTLTQGFPVLPAAQIPSLIGKNGEFHAKSQFKRRWLTKQIRESEITAELRAQFQRFFDIAGVPAFWCTHQDIHIFPGLFRTCVTLGVELGIPAMRSHRRVIVSRNYTPMEYNIRHPAFWLKSRIVAQWSGWAERLGMCMPDGQIQLRGYNMSLPEVEHALTHMQWPTARDIVELTVHPATVIDEKLFSALRNSRLHEYEVFGNPALKEFLNSNEIELVGYDILN
jgi:predicted glycoside hydrolase/deacetylase ChbG (UPF0249 family)